MEVMKNHLKENHFSSEKETNSEAEIDNDQSEAIDMIVQFLLKNILNSFSQMRNFLIWMFLFGKNLMKKKRQMM